MTLPKMFPYALAVCFALNLLAVKTQAQTETLRPRQVAAVTNQRGLSRLENDPIIISTADETDEYPSAESVMMSRATAPSLARSAGMMRFDQLLTSAIDTRIGARYVWGASGPYVFDCSGFVWSAFQSAGISFERGSARTLWSRFAPARKEEETKFGTLVFFSGLTHIGIVADEHGFYHASRHHGVTYSPFNDYWLKRIDGFRRVPLPTQLTAE
ncbi:MAG TPA: C40 family peptidase [Pyrinomonadaceae bacterium]|nr:C40 family peptidase [Pyrinomonadaceae bacterium]